MDNRAQRPRSRPSDKQPIKRGNSSSSQQNMTAESKKIQEQMQPAAQSAALDESGEDGEEEAYELDYDEDEDQVAAEPAQMLNRSKPGVNLNPVNEEVKEMKSVDEETNKDGESDEDDAMGLRDVNEIATPKEDNSKVEQNEHSFRDQNKQPSANDEEDNYSDE